MKFLAYVYVLPLALGLVFGWFPFGGVSGSVLGLFIATCIVVPLYCLVSAFARQVAIVAESSFQDAHLSVNPDVSRLPLVAYDQIGPGSLRQSLDRVESRFPDDLD